MTTAAKLLFTGKTHVTSGPDGAAHANDGSLDIKLAQPHPAAENLFAAAWSACYLARSASPPPNARSSCRASRRSTQRST